MRVPGAEPLKQALKAAVVELHPLAGSAACDAALNDHTMYHYTRRLELATDFSAGRGSAVRRGGYRGAGPPL
jgi:hypothetical protein